jgi:hypothetical protein
MIRLQEKQATLGWTIPFRKLISVTISSNMCVMFGKSFVESYMILVMSPRRISNSLVTTYALSVRATCLIGIVLDTYYFAARHFHSLGTWYSCSHAYIYTNSMPTSVVVFSLTLGRRLMRSTMGTEAKDCDLRI